MVHEDLDQEGRPVEVIPPWLQGMDDYKEFMVIDIIVVFGRDEWLGEVGVWVSVTVGISLEEDGARSVLSSISGDGERFGEVREMSDGVWQEEFLQQVKGLLTGGGPIPTIILFCEVEEGVSDSGVVGDEPAIEAGEAKEGVYLLDFGGG